MFKYEGDGGGSKHLEMILAALRVIKTANQCRKLYYRRHVALISFLSMATKLETFHPL